MLGSARVSRAGDRVLAIANFDVLLVSDSRRHPRQARFAAQAVQRFSRHAERANGVAFTAAAGSRVGPDSLRCPFVIAKFAWKSVSARTPKPAREPRALPRLSIVAFW
jgi:hypothetical protein